MEAANAEQDALAQMRAGITVPLFRAMGRWEKTKHADLTCMGHWHQRYCLPDVMVNGSLIGYDAYAMGGGFPHEPPVQWHVLSGDTCGVDLRDRDRILPLQAIEQPAPLARREVVTSP